MDECTFCPIAAAEVDADLVAVRTEQVFCRSRAAASQGRDRPVRQGRRLDRVGTAGNAGGQHDISQVSTDNACYSQLRA
jgi:hypothetical protein